MIGSKDERACARGLGVYLLWRNSSSFAFAVQARFTEKKETV